MNNKQAAGMPPSPGELDRRSFLRKSALVAGGAAASNLIRIPAFATTLTTDSPVATTRSGQVRG